MEREFEESTSRFHELEIARSTQDFSHPLRSFSNFHALRRAYRNLTATVGPIPNIFAVFTDTTLLRITNFQPTSRFDPATRVPLLPEHGEHQFPPIFIFPIVDVFSRVLGSHNCLCKPAQVADPEHLLEFGRAG